MLKSEIRILGFDDGAFAPNSKNPVIVIGVVFRGGKFIDGALKTEVTVDGTDATEKIEKLINTSRHKQQLKVIMLDGITVGGFNVIDVKRLNEKTGIPVIVVNRKMPDMKKVKDALKKLGDFEARWKSIEDAGPIRECNIKEFKRVYYQNIGMENGTAEEVIRLSCTRGFIPEPLRVAHLIATAVVRGESYGRA